MWWNFTDISNWFGSSGRRLANSTLFHCFSDVITNSRPKHGLPCFQHAFLHTLVSLLDLFQHFLMKGGRYEKSRTLCNKSIFDFCSYFLAIPLFECVIIAISGFLLEVFITRWSEAVVVVYSHYIWHINIYHPLVVKSNFFIPSIICVCISFCFLCLVIPFDMQIIWGGVCNPPSISSYILVSLGDLGKVICISP